MKRKPPVKETLLNRLKRTMIAITIVMVVIWCVFYEAMERKIEQYTMNNMEQASLISISELNRIFLQLEELAFVLQESNETKQFLKSGSTMEFYQNAPEVDEMINSLAYNADFKKNVILYDNNGRFYRFSGTINNTSIARIRNVIDEKEEYGYTQIQLDGDYYTGYFSTITEHDNIIGRVVMLIDENDIDQMFKQLENQDNMKIALAAEDTILVSNIEELEGCQTIDIFGTSNYYVSRQIGFTPFEIFVSYEDTDQSIKIFCYIGTFLLGSIFLYILWMFIRFWKKEFFMPIQSIIDAVENLDVTAGEVIPMPEQAHLNSLVIGINVMAERVASLQDAEIKKQRALIISLKKQISAHFTVNVLNLIKALSTSGENQKAGKLCDGLSHLYRYANDADHYISVMDEFFILDKYADIMELRYPDRFDIEIEMVDYLQDIKIPRMLLQPIVENSIVHGYIEKSLDRRGEIHIYSMKADNKLKIIIADNGIGIADKQLAKLRKSLQDANEKNDVEVDGISHVALINIQRRIMNYFGMDYGIEIGSNVDKGTRVVVTIPIIMK